MSTKEKEKQEAIAKLRKWLKPGDTVYTILRHVSKSGMSREIGVVILKGKGETVDLHPNFLIATACGDKLNTRGDGIKVSGCGMDMGFHLVYNLGRVLFPKGFKLPKGRHGRNGDTSGYDQDGGYALTQRWL